MMGLKNRWNFVAITESMVDPWLMKLRYYWMGREKGAAWLKDRLKMVASYKCSACSIQGIGEE